MIPYVFSMLASEWPLMNVARYITFRAPMALLSALLISFIFSPWFIRRLKNGQLRQVIREDGPDSHYVKRGTPTMGGGLIILSVLIPSFLWMDLNSPFLWLPFIVVASYGALGFLDDYLKIRAKNSQGVRPYGKLIWQFSVAAIVVVIFQYWYGDQGSYDVLADSGAPQLSLVYVPFLKQPFTC